MQIQANSQSFAHDIDDLLPNNNNIIIKFEKDNASQTYFHLVN